MIARVPTATDATVAPADERLYDVRFWLAYAAYALVYAAHALLFHFAGFVTLLGGHEQDAGRVVALGLVAALAGRHWLGRFVDRHGARRPWLMASMLYVIGCFLLSRQEAVGWALYAARVVFALGFAGMLACAIAHVAARAPERRRTEVVGMLEKSVFVGLAIGSIGGDALFAHVANPRQAFAWLFGIVTVVGVAHGLLAHAATRGTGPSPTSGTRPALKLHESLGLLSGSVAASALMLGMNFALTTVFIAGYFKHLGFAGMGTFFTAYCVFAFALRLATRRFGETHGTYRMVQWGLVGMALGQASFLVVSHPWHLLLPALGCAWGRALLYPAIVSRGAGAFPPHQRGLGTALVLGVIDVGTLASAPLLGAIIDHAGHAPAFAVATLAILAVAGSNAWSQQQAREPESVLGRDAQEEDSPKG